MPTGALFTDTNTQNTYVSSDFTHDSLTGFVSNEHIDWTADQGATNIHSGNYTNTNTFRGIHDTPSDGATTTSISSNWAFDNVKTAVPAGAIFTDNNTQRAIHDTPVNGATTTSISSNWAFDNVKTAVPTGALFTDTDNNTQLSSAQITAMGFSTTDNDTTYTSSDFTHNSLSGVSANEHLDWTADQGATNIHANNYTNTNTQLSSGDITAMGFSTTDNDTTYTSSDFTHNSLSGVSANEHLDWTADQGATNIHANNYTNTNTQLSSGDITAMGFSTTDNDTTYTSSDFTHNSLSGVSANEHIDWTADQGATNIHANNYTNTNTQLSSGDITAMGFSTTDNNTQLSEAEITAMGFTQSAGTVGGSGADNRIPKFSTGGSNVENSTITDSGSQVSLSEGSLLLNDTTFNQIKASGLMQFIGTSNATETLRIGGTTIDWNDVNIYGQSLNFKPGNVDKFTIDNGGSVMMKGNLNLSNATATDVVSAANLTVRGTTNDTETLKIGSATIGWKSATIYTPTMQFKSGSDVDFVDINPLVGDVVASGGFKVDGGTSSQFLKADGSVDTNTYATGTVPTLTSDLTNDSGFITGVSWGGLGGNQDDIALSEFDDDLGVLTSLSGAVLTSSTNQSIGGTKTFTGTAKFNGNFGNLDTTLDKGVQFEIGTTGLNTMRCDADSWRIYFGGTTGIGQAYIVNQLGQHDWDGSSGVNRMRLTAAGTLHVDGDVIAYSTTVSDKRLKDNIQTIENASETVKKLRGVSYEWNAGHRKGDKEIGLVAQEVEEVLPFLVREHELPLNRDVDNETLYKTVDYEKIVGLLIEDSKEKDARIEKLEALVELMLKDK